MYLNGSVFASVIKMKRRSTKDKETEQSFEGLGHTERV